MKSSQVVIGDNGLASQYNNLREDAKKAGDLLAHQQGTPGLTLYVEAGNYFVGSTRVKFAGGSSGSFTAPTTNPRIDLLVIDSTGTLSIVSGAEGASPAVPAYPNDKLVICEVYNRVGQTSIRDVDTAGQGYIYADIRGQGFSYISNVAQIANGLITDAKLVSAFVHNSTDETVNGIKTFGSIPVLPASDPTTDNQAARKLYVDSNTPGKILKKDFSTNSHTGDATETDLKTLTISANSLSTNKGLRVRITAKMIATNGNAYLRLKFGATTLLTRTTYNTTDQILIDLILMNKTASTQGLNFFVLLTNSTNRIIDQIAYDDSAAEDTTADKVLKITGQGAVAGDTSYCHSMFVEQIN